MVSRFIEAQKYSYEQALNEIKRGRKESHWIWYIFPQLKGLGTRENSEIYGIADIDEAHEYMSDPVLSARLIEISEELLKLDSCNPVEVMGGYTDACKLKSCMTLFSVASPETEVFEKVLEKFFNGKKDGKTLGMLEK